MIAQIFHPQLLRNILQMIGIRFVSEQAELVKKNLTVTVLGQYLWCEGLL